MKYYFLSYQTETKDGVKFTGGRLIKISKKIDLPELFSSEIEKIKKEIEVKFGKSLDVAVNNLYRVF